MEAKKSIPYETNAEIRIVEGWCCKACDKYWGSGESGERAAKYCCCTDRLCQRCEVARAPKHYTVCDSCRQFQEIEKFEKLESRPYDGSAVVEWDGDRYFFDEEDLLDYYIESDINVDNIRLVFAECIPPTWDRNVSEILCDDLGEDMGWDTREIDAQITAWVSEHAPKVYWPTNIAVNQESIAGLIANAKDVT